MRAELRRLVLMSCDNAGARCGAWARAQVRNAILAVCHPPTDGEHGGDESSSAAAAVDGSDAAPPAVTSTYSVLLSTNIAGFLHVYVRAVARVTFFFLPRVFVCLWLPLHNVL